MNKFKSIAAAIITTIALTGCMDTIYESRSTAVERSIFRAIEDASCDHNKDLYNDVIQAMNRRPSAPFEGNHKSMCNLKPLINLGTRIMTTSSHNVHDYMTFEDAYEAMYGFTFEEACDPEAAAKTKREAELKLIKIKADYLLAQVTLKEAPAEAVINETVPSQERQHAVTIDENMAVLSHDMMSHLIDAIKNCPRAKAKYVTLTDQGMSVSVKLYREMGGIIHKCQALQIEKSL